MTIGEAVKERILQLCAERDLTINKLSTISGVTQSTVNNVVGGRNNSTTVSTLHSNCSCPYPAVNASRSATVATKATTAAALAAVSHRRRTRCRLREEACARALMRLCSTRLSTYVGDSL